jgi:long-chain acyl-CoA synthetase
MNFWKINHPKQQLAVIDTHSGREWTYGQLGMDVASLVAATPAPSRKSLQLLLAQNCYECIVAYLAALTSGDALMLVDATLNRELLLALINTYKPDLVRTATSNLEMPFYRQLSGQPIGTWQAENNDHSLAIHDSLALLLNTSGSTGSPKLVRLSLHNLQSNAESISAYLQLTLTEKPITSLPMAYSYGLSVINSHLLAGACLVLTEYGVVRREFWDCIDRYGCTSFGGVPYTYQMLLQMGLLKTRGASLRTLTQAGGRLAEVHIAQMKELALQRGFKFFVMYGQTEATARISYVPFEHLDAKIGSIGIAVPGGSLSLDNDAGELIYAGPNVMLGYAESREDLEKGDELQGVLRTGDLARQDQDGFFYLTGRLKRFLKMFGKRFNLDEVERLVQRRFQVPVACYGRDDLLVVAVEAQTADHAQISAMLRETFALPAPSIKVLSLPSLPRTSSGKIDYPVLLIKQGLATGAATQG